MTHQTKSAAAGDGRRPRGNDRRISVRAVRRQPLDYRKLARALIAVAEAEAAAQADDQPTAKRQGTPPKEVA